MHVNYRKEMERNKCHNILKKYTIIINTGQHICQSNILTFI